MQLMRFVPVLVVVTLLAACGSSQEATLDGREFLSTSVTDDGAPRALVPGTQVRLAFDDGGLGASAGCNSIGGDYRVEDGVLMFDGGSMTEMGCDPDRHAQDDWLVAFLASRPSVALDGPDLLLTSGGTAVALTDREVAEPDLPLTGTTWTVDTIITGDAAASVPEGVVATFTFSDNGRVDVDSGCGTGFGSYEATATQLRFANVTVADCDDGPHSLAAAILPIVGAEVVDYEIEAGRLTLQAGDDGLGLGGS